MEEEELSEYVRRNVMDNIITLGEARFDRIANRNPIVNVTNGIYSSTMTTPFGYKRNERINPYDLHSTQLQEDGITSITNAIEKVVNFILYKPIKPIIIRRSFTGSADQLRLMIAQRKLITDIDETDQLKVWHPIHKVVEQLKNLQLGSGASDEDINKAVRLLMKADPESVRDFVRKWAIKRVCARIDVVSKNTPPYWTRKLFIDLHGVTPFIIHPDNTSGIMQCTSTVLHGPDNDHNMIYTLSSIVNSLSLELCSE